MTLIEKYYWYKEHEEEIETLFIEYFKNGLKNILINYQILKMLENIDFSILNR